MILIQAVIGGKIKCKFFMVSYIFALCSRGMGSMEALILDDAINMHRISIQLLRVDLVPESDFLQISIVCVSVLSTVFFEGSNSKFIRNLQFHTDMSSRKRSIH